MLTQRMRQAIDYFISRLDIQPVLIDIGASGAPPAIWEPIAPYATYVGFDPDSRELHELSDGPFRRAIIVNKAVTSDPECDEVLFYFTQSPYCSSTLEPDSESLADYLFADLFVVESTGVVPASSLDRILNDLSLSHIDWFKTDSQGTDLRLFKSLPDALRSRVLAVDVEPGLIDAYVGEDLFVDAHTYLTQNGFWLSNLNVCGAVRMSRATLQAAQIRGMALDEQLGQSTVRKSPGWCEARYLKTVKSLANTSSLERDFALLWIIALLDGQLGFAVELGHQYEKTFGNSEISDFMQSEPIMLMRQIHRTARLTWFASLPRRGIRRAILALRQLILGG